MESIASIDERMLELEEEDLSNITTSRLIALTFSVYGSLFAIVFLLYILVRPHFPRSFNFINNSADHTTNLAGDVYGRISWIWKIFQHSDEEIYRDCGMDAIVFLRWLRFGRRVSLVGIFSSLYLIPVNLLGCPEDDNFRDFTAECRNVKDLIEKTGIGNVRVGSYKLLATTIAAYIQMLYALWLLYKECQWFTETRHRFLKEQRINNYTVYVAHIPLEYRSDAALKEYFRTVFSNDEVLDAKIALDVPKLEKNVQRREEVVKNLEHAINVKTVRKRDPKHFTARGEKVLSIPAYTRELNSLNESISETITRIEELKEDERDKFKQLMQQKKLNRDLARLKSMRRLDSRNSRLTIDNDEDDDDDDDKDDDDEEKTIMTSGIILEHDDDNVEEEEENDTTDPQDQEPRVHFSESTKEESVTSLTRNQSDSDISSIRPPQTYDDPSITSPLVWTSPVGSSAMGGLNDTEHSSSSINDSESFDRHKSLSSESISTYSKSHKSKISSLSVDALMKKSLGTVIRSIDTVKNVSIDSVKGIASKTMKLASESYNMGSKTLHSAFSLIKGTDDGKIREGGFVTFNSLMAKQQSLQMIHHQEAYTFEIHEAPVPKHVFWNNVGLAHEQKQFGNLISLASTAALCLFWTIPVTFLSSLAEVDELKKMLPWLEDWIEAEPQIEAVLAVLKPLLLLILMNLLPSILTIFCKFEGHIDITSLQASLFLKLSVFLIIQVFFVQVISGSILTELDKILKDWTRIMNLLATSVPAQVKSFLQYVLLQTFVKCSTELLRVQSILSSFIRDLFGPNITQKERDQQWKMFAPLSMPTEMDYAKIVSEIMVYFMVMFVYGSVAPIMSFVSFFVFCLLSLTYRNQLIYIYCKTNDSGGQRWEVTAKLIFASMVVAQVTIIGIMSIKKSAIAGLSMIPLLAVTVLFAAYMNQKHYMIAKYLPSTMCKEEDAENSTMLIDRRWMKREYLQPALTNKTLYPDNFPATLRNVDTALLQENMAEEESLGNYFSPTNSELRPEDDSSILQKAS